MTPKREYASPCSWSQRSTCSMYLQVLTREGFGDTHPSMFKEHGCNVYLAAEIKKHVSIPVATLGGLNDPEQMEEIIASGKADVVYMARALFTRSFPSKKGHGKQG